MKLGGQVGCVPRTTWFGFQWRSGSGYKNFLKWFFTIKRWDQKRYKAWYLKTLWTDLDETWGTSWVCDKVKPIQFWWRSGSGCWNFKVIRHNWEMGLKLFMAWYFKKLDWLWQNLVDECVGDQNKLIGFCLRSECRSGRSVGYKT